MMLDNAKDGTLEIIHTSLSNDVFVLDVRFHSSKAIDVLIFHILQCPPLYTIESRKYRCKLNPLKTLRKTPATLHMVPLTFPCASFATPFAFPAA